VAKPNARPTTKILIRLALLGALVLMILALMFILSDRDDPRPSLPESTGALAPSGPREIPPSSSATNSTSTTNGALKETSTACLGAGFALNSLSQLESYIQTQGPYELNHHWDNYFYQNAAGEKMIIHVVPDQLPSGKEVLKVKEFRDDEDGPTLIQESFTLDKEKLNLFKASKESVESLNFASGLEILRTLKEGELREVRISNDNGVLDCEILEGADYCECR
jgi:hypothetical protein